MASSVIKRETKVITENVTFIYDNYNLWRKDTSGIVLSNAEPNMIINQTTPNLGGYVRIYDMTTGQYKPTSESPWTVECQVLYS